MEYQNKAAVLPSLKAHPFTVIEHPVPALGPSNLLIRVRAAAVNPCDYVIQAAGVIITEFPTVVGCDGAGEVVAVGSAVTRFAPGDRVTAMVPVEGDLTSMSGTFQEYFVADETMTAKIPDDLSYSKATVLPLGLMTAAAGLFEKTSLALPYPQLSPKPNGKVLVVWGASSSVGSCAVQMAVAAGFEVAATAGAANQDYCRGIGAKWVFDHRSPTVNEDIIKALEGRDSAGVYCAVFTPMEVLVTAGELAQGLGGKQAVATVLAPGMPLPEGVPKGVEYGINAAPRDMDVVTAVWEKWLPGALANGSMQCKPDPKIVGKGLDKAQEAVDLMGKGVSATKLVIEL